MIRLMHFVSFSTTRLNKSEMTYALNQQIHHFFNLLLVQSSVTLNL